MKKREDISSKDVIAVLIIVVVLSVAVSLLVVNISQPVVPDSSLDTGQIIVKGLGGNEAGEIIVEFAEGG